MDNLDIFFTKPQYEWTQQQKEELFFPVFNKLHENHLNRSSTYKSTLEHLKFGFDIEGPAFIPVSMFKTRKMLSVEQDQVHKVLTSSGTTGQSVSQIFLDAETATLQAKALQVILTSELGTERLPMMIIDAKSTVANRDRFSARGAGILGLMNFGRDHHFILKDDLSVDMDVVNAFLTKYKGKPFLIFGFTFLVWKTFMLDETLPDIDLSLGALIHSGGWKKLESQSVNNAVFKSELNKRHGLNRFYNFYGMVEQVGSIFLEGTDGYLYPPKFADVIVRDPKTLRILPPGETGVIQMLSLLPRSYPGHSILTEDMGRVVYVDKGAGGRQGKALEVLGRIPQAELRGCSDVIAGSVQP